MRSAGVYLIQAQIGTVRNAVIPAGDILITLRVGRSSASASINNPHPCTELHFGTLIQLNVDSSALETQRCSISFNGVDKRIVGIALISLPRDKTLLQNTYRFTQNEDKRAEVDVKVKIAPFQVPKSSPAESRKQKETLPPPSPENIIPRIYTNGASLKQEALSNNPQNVASSKSKISQEMSISSEDRKTPKSFKVREEDRVVQTTESELKRFKEEKEAYYQLYQIEKAKNEVAAKFISNLMRKIADKHPSLLSIVSEDSKKGTELNGDKKGKSQVDSAMVAQLEQANRSLHRQVEEYKKIVQQMKCELGNMGHNSNSLGIPRVGDIPLHSKASNTFLLPGLFEPVKSTLQQRSNIKPSTISLTPPPAAVSVPVLPSNINSSEQPQQRKKVNNNHNLTDIDFKKWLDLSIGQREEIQALLGNLPQKQSQSQEKNEKLLKKLKASLDKSYAALLSKKDLSRQALMAHRKEVNRCFEEALAA